MSPWSKTIKILLSVALICSSCGSRIPYTCVHTTFTLRGGTSTDADDDFDSLSNHMHGIIDLRPDPADLDSVLLIQHNDIVQEALLNHTSYCDAEKFNIEDTHIPVFNLAHTHTHTHTHTLKHLIIICLLMP